MSVQIDGSTGNIIAIKADYSGDVSIGGTLTYEDVTNIDSVGLITARSGVKFGASGTTISGNSTGIGIGEASPTRKLVVAGDTNTVAVVRGATNGTSSLFLGDSDDEDIGALTYNHPSNYLAITVNTSERLRIDSSGDYLLLGGTLRIKNAANDAQRGAIYGDASSFHINAGVNNLIAYSAGTERLRIDSSGRLLLGTNTSSGFSSARLIVNSAGSSSTESGNLVLQRGEANGSISSGDAIGNLSFADESGYTYAVVSANADVAPGSDSPGRLVFSTTADGASSSTERLRITSGGKVQVTGTRGGSLQPSDNDSLELYTSATSGNADTGSGLTFYNNDGNGAEIGGTIQVAKENGNTNNTAGYMRFSTRANNSDPAERMRIASGGNVYIGQTNGSFGNSGHIFGAGGQAFHINPGDTVLLLNRQNNDGEIVRIAQDGNTEGTISVSGSTVSYNGGHLARWSQLPSGAARTEILRGSVLSNLDEMCEWGEEDNEQLNRMKVSDVEGDINVSGVFQAWDDDDDTYTNDFYCAMTGDFVIRIASGVTVQRGNLLMSAGDGTAKPQGDGYIQDKTIAKVTSTTRSVTYSDGSYCVPCVLMAC